MMYLYTGGRTGKKGRPKEYDGKIDFKKIEFCYRDSKQFTGLCECQARDFDKLDFAFNASLTSVNVAKVVINTEYPTFSIANFKSLLYNCYLMKRFFAMSGFRPNKSLNAMIFKELSDIAARAA